MTFKNNCLDERFGSKYPAHSSLFREVKSAPKSWDPMALKWAWSMVVLCVSLATDGEFMAKDDECGAETCALNALQLKRSREVEVRLAEDEGCHDVTESDGGPCWDAMMWGKFVGVPKHPNWFQGRAHMSNMIFMYLFFRMEMMITVC